MTDEKKNRIESALDDVNPARRRFLQRILMGSGAVALISGPASELLAQRGEGGGQGGKGGGGKGGGGKGGGGKGQGGGKGPGSGGKGQGGKGQGGGKGKGSV